VKTGASILVCDLNMANAVEFVALTDGWFLTVSHYPDAPPNGNRMQWQAVLQYLVTVAKAYGSDPSGYQWSVRRDAQVVTLGKVLSASALARIFDVEAGQIRAVLEDYLVVIAR
jgi:hypothetical protein